MKNRNFFLYFFLLICLILPGAFAAWNLLSSSITGVSPNANTTLTPVCYNDTSKKEFLSIEVALSEAKSGETVYVKPDLKKPIYLAKNVTINPGVTLTLAYEYNESNNTFTWDNEKEFAKYSGGFADQNPGANRVTQLIVQENVKITNKGNLNIGGITGQVGNSTVSCTSNLYTELTLLNGSLIDNYGTIHCNGYIKKGNPTDNCKVILRNSSYCRVPFIIYDYKGGKQSSSMISGGTKVFPFNSYDLPNIHAPLDIYYGARFVGQFKVIASKIPISMELNVIANNEAILLLRSGKISMEYVPETFGTTKQSTKNKTVVNIYGDLEFGSLTIKFPLIGNISSRDYFLPVGYNFDIIVKSGFNLNIGTRIKIMNGCNIYIEDGANLFLDSEILIFENEQFVDTGAASSYSYNLKRASVTINGKLNAGPNSKIGGIIETRGSGTLDFSKINESSLSATIHEGYSKQEVTLHAKGWIDKKTDAVTDVKNFEPAKKYYATGDHYWTTYLKYKINYFTVFIDETGNKTIEPSTGTHPFVDTNMEENIIFKRSDVTISNDKYLDGIYLDKDLNELMTDDSISLSELLNHVDNTTNEINIYYKVLKSKKVTVKYLDSFNKEITSLTGIFNAGQIIDLATTNTDEIINEDKSDVTCFQRTIKEFINWTYNDLIYKPGDKFTIPSDQSEIIFKKTTKEAVTVKYYRVLIADYVDHSKRKDTKQGLTNIIFNKEDCFDVTPPTLSELHPINLNEVQYGKPLYVKEGSSIIFTIDKLHKAVLSKENPIAIYEMIDENDRNLNNIIANGKQTSTDALHEVSVNITKASYFWCAGA